MTKILFRFIDDDDGENDDNHYDSVVVIIGGVIIDFIVYCSYSLFKF